MERILGWFIEEPQRLIDSGWLLTLAGFILLFSGLWGLVTTTSVNAVSSVAPGVTAPPSKVLADIYPMLPTWWIPESPLGFVLPVVLIILGWIVAMAGKQIKRVQG